MASIQTLTVKKVEIHPLVLLSVTDHYNRIAKDTKKRVVGCLLGQSHRGTMSVTNCFAVPFDEESKPPATWFLDCNYLEDMAHMFKRVNANERIVGWYSTGPRLKANDIDIHKLFFAYHKEPVFVIIRVAGDQKGINLIEMKTDDNFYGDINETGDGEDLPTNAYAAIDVIQHDGRHEKEFAHVQSGVAASEAEAVGVEHLLREIQDISLSTLTTEVARKLSGLRGLLMRLKVISDYLDAIANEDMPISQEILKNLQLIFNLMPNLSKESLVKSFAITKNDTMISIFIASLLRSVLALDGLLQNKIENKLKEETLAKSKETEEKSEK